MTQHCGTMRLTQQHRLSWLSMALHAAPQGTTTLLLVSQCVVEMQILGILICLHICFGHFYKSWYP